MSEPARRLRAGRHVQRAAVRHVRGAVGARPGARGPLRDHQPGPGQRLRQGRHLRMGRRGAHHVKTNSSLFCLQSRPTGVLDSPKKLSLPARESNEVLVIF